MTINCGQRGQIHHHLGAYLPSSSRHWSRRSAAWNVTWRTPPGTCRTPTVHEPDAARRASRRCPSLCQPGGQPGGGVAAKTCLPALATAANRFSRCQAYGLVSALAIEAAPALVDARRALARGQSRDGNRQRGCCHQHPYRSVHNEHLSVARRAVIHRVRVADRPVMPPARNRPDLYFYAASPSESTSAHAAMTCTRKACCPVTLWWVRSSSPGATRPAGEVVASAVDLRQ